MGDETKERPVISNSQFTGFNLKNLRAKKNSSNENEAKEMAVDHHHRQRTIRINELLVGYRKRRLKARQQVMIE
jgi:hypothetical protein